MLSFPIGFMGAGGDYAPAVTYPDTVSGLQLWFDADDAASITHSSGAVSNWADKSGNGRHAYQSTGGVKPTTGSTTINGKNVLAFDGGDALIIDDFAYSVTGQTIFIVADVNTTSEQYLFAHYDTASNQRAWGLYSATSSKLLVHAVSSDGTNAALKIASSSNAIGSDPILLAARWSAGDTDIYLDGSEETILGTPATIMANSTAKLSIGARFISATLATFVTGSMAEIIFYDRVLSDVEMTGISSYLLDKWGL